MNRLSPRRLLAVVAVLEAAVFYFVSSVAGLAAPSSGRAVMEPAGMLTPRLSPDGDWIVCSYQGAIAKVARAGGPLQVLSRDEGWDSDPAWSPDGARIVCISICQSPAAHAPEANCALLTRTGRRLHFPHLVHAAAPFWFHPDGRRLLGRFGNAAGVRLGWLNLDTGQATPLHFGAPDERIARQQLTPYALADDGRAIFFAVHQDIPGQQTGDNGPQADLFRAPAEGGTAELIRRFPARIYGLSSDGRNQGVYAVTDFGAAHTTCGIFHLLRRSEARANSPSARQTRMRPRRLQVPAGSCTRKIPTARRDCCIGIPRPARRSRWKRNASLTASRPGAVTLALTDAQDAERGTIDVNQPLLDGKLAARLILVYNRDNEFRHYAHEQHQRALLTTKYNLTPKTRFRVDFERGQRKARQSQAQGQRVRTP